MSDSNKDITVEEKPHSGLWALTGAPVNEATATDTRTGEQYHGSGDANEMKKAVNEAVSKLKVARAAKK